MAHSKIPAVPLLDRLGWDVSEYAGLAGCSPAFVWRLIRDGKLDSVKVAGRRIISREAGLKLLKSASRPRPTSHHGRAVVVPRSPNARR
jgi:hypothetical protein